MRRRPGAEPAHPTSVARHRCRVLPRGPRRRRHRTADRAGAAGSAGTAASVCPGPAGRGRAGSAAAGSRHRRPAGGGLRGVRDRSPASQRGTRRQPWPRTARGVRPPAAPAHRRQHAHRNPSVHAPLPVLVGREVELRTMRRLLADAAAGSGSALLVRGTPGVGKSALLRAAAAEAAERGFGVLSTAGVETERWFPFAALHLLLQPVIASCRGTAGCAPGHLARSVRRRGRSARRTSGRVRRAGTSRGRRRPATGPAALRRRAMVRHTQPGGAELRRPANPRPLHPDRGRRPPRQHRAAHRGGSAGTTAGTPRPYGRRRSAGCRHAWPGAVDAGAHPGTLRGQSAGPGRTTQGRPGHRRGRTRPATDPATEGRVRRSYRHGEPFLPYVSSCPGRGADRGAGPAPRRVEPAHRLGRHRGRAARERRCGTGHSPRPPARIPSSADALGHLRTSDGHRAGGRSPHSGVSAARRTGASAISSGRGHVRPGRRTGRPARAVR